MDEYLDEFRDLIDQAGYTEDLAIVIKFRRGLRRDIQDQIATLPGRPKDDDQEGWYLLATQCTNNQETNDTFHGNSGKSKS